MQSIRAVAPVAAVAAGVPLAIWIGAIVVGREPPYNDFQIYWLAGRLLLEGRSPYDLAAMSELAAAHDLRFVLGTGYSYPLPFAIVIAPLALLPPPVALVAFQVLSLVALGAAVGWWSGRFCGSAPRRRVLFVAALAGLFPPVLGTLANGQANLLLLPLLAGGFAWAVQPSRLRGGVGAALVGLAAVVKIVPGVAVLPLLVAGRPLRAGLVIATPLAALGIANLLAPWAAHGSQRLASLLGPDSYVTNQSINGFVTRLVEASDRTVPLVPGGFDPGVVGAVLTIGFGGLTAWAIVVGVAGSRSPSSPWAAMALALVAATIAAPKSSFWNAALVLPAVGVVLASTCPDLSLRRLPGPDRWLLLGCGLGAAAQVAVWLVPPAVSRDLVLVTMLESSGLFGLLALWLLLMRRVVAARPRPVMAPAVA